MQWQVQGVANVGAFVKTHGKQASAAVGKQASAAVERMQKLRQASSPHNSHPSTPTFAEALGAEHISTAPSTVLPDFLAEAAPSGTFAAEAVNASPLASQSSLGKASSASRGELPRLPSQPAASLTRDEDGMLASDGGEFLERVTSSSDQSNGDQTPSSLGPETNAAQSQAAEPVSTAASSVQPPSAFVGKHHRERKAVFLRIQATDVKVDRACSPP
jgi:hypothetical protein